MPLWLEESDFIGVHAGLPVRAERVLPPEEAEPEELVEQEASAMIITAARARASFFFISNSSNPYLL